MDTRKWGPPLWFSMFTIASNYNVSIDINNRNDVAKKRYYKTFFTNIGNVLPCKYCRRSYKKFLKELPIDKFLDSRQKLMYWLYKIKDKVNKKLLKQEKEGFSSGKFKTTPSPPFKKVCAHYEQFRAHCSDKTKSCRKPTLQNVQV